MILGSKKNSEYYRRIAHLVDTKYKFSDLELEEFAHHSCVGMECDILKNSYPNGSECPLEGSRCSKLTSRGLGAIVRIEELHNKKVKSK